MTFNEKLARLKVLIGTADGSEDERLSTLLEIAGESILGYMYAMRGGVPYDVQEVPDEYANTQIMAVIVGYGLLGAEGQVSHSENGISRQFSYPDMQTFIRRHVIAYAGGVAGADAESE